jgi:putative nucleotidyltransferase with HDIG domain
MELRMRKLLHNLSALADLSSEITSTHNFEEVMRASLHTLLGALAISKGVIARFSSRPLQLKVIAARGLTGAAGARLRIGREEVEFLAVNQRPIELSAERNTTRHAHLAAQFVQRNTEILKRLRAALMVPLIARGELVGAILLASKFSGESFSDEDLEIITVLARNIAIAIYNHRLLISLRRKVEENRRLYRQVHQMYQEVIRAFGAAIDLKDAYTAGHSDRVARYAEAIAREMGVSGRELEHITVAGYLHDIGKIVVDRSIINNPRPLTEREYRELNKHVITGYEILSNIGHPWDEIAYVTKCHHERVDGKGYPQGLHGDQIPLGAKIVNLADSFDAMITDRPYRSRLSLETALEDVRRNAGKQFAPDVVAAFCRALLKEISGRSRQRALSMTFGRGYDRQVITDKLSSMLAELEAGS